jgi:lipase maturation factor 1
VVARTFHRALALIYGIAWLSLGAQVEVLIGSRGLLPIAPYLERAPRDFVDFPTVFLWGAGDAALVGGIWVGLALAVLWLLGVAPRLMAALSALLYLSYATAAREFLWFQWDSMLIEAGILAAMLPRDREAPLAHLALRLLLFKVYFESGLAKWTSPVADWESGTAMVHYYETAPLPGPLAWTAHHLPLWWHYLESRAVLVLETALPFLFFLGRRPRRVAAVLFSGFMVADILTANYGFFCYLTLVLHLLLFDDRDLERSRDWLAARAPATLGRLRQCLARLPRPLGRLRQRLARLPRALAGLGPRLARARRPAAIALVIIYVSLSALEAAATIYGYRGADAIRRHHVRWRVFNSYHLFASVTVDRFEPIFETFDGQRWTEHHLRYKPGAPGERPGQLLPHLPRVDFRLWFYGLSFVQARPPAYVSTLLERLCHDPDAVASLFARPLPAAPEAVRVSFQRYRFTTGAQRESTGAFWQREPFSALPPRPCRPRLD